MQTFYTKKSFCYPVYCYKKGRLADEPFYIDTSMQKGHNLKNQCYKVITEEPSAVRS